MGTRDATNGSVEPIIAIGGPTGVGKTAVAVCLAEAIGGELVSADSMAVYRGMNIGTAKPTEEERRRVPCHVIDVVEPDATFNAALFQESAAAAIRGIRARGRRPIVVGGTGFYLRALLDDLDLSHAPADEAVRNRWLEYGRIYGSAALHLRLAAVDSVAAQRLHPNDTVRLVRALEVFEVTGKPMTQVHADAARGRKPYHAVRYLLTMPLPALDERINARVDAMLAAGWLDEVRGLRQSGYSADCPGMRALGYMDLCRVVDGVCTVQEAAEMTKRATRRFARRQLTWFRSDQGWEWLDICDSAADEIAQVIAGRMVNNNPARAAF
ncbi:MAG: tRNA (adenosine(37)-N6)-dimethylallyltransferase MiaA [Armatimonadetes bacterium]|nr:tRNA (adenosine(37)-N6)-dimethylallyltransferase MiaA [Armatimonadota bacterium]